MLNELCKSSLLCCRHSVRHIVITALLISVSLPSASQTDRIISLATTAYESGRFEQADSILNNSIALMNSNDRLNAYRILALSNIQMDRMDAAEQYVSLLLDEAPDYVSYDDSPRFIKILDKLKKNSTKISTASRMAEKLEESPVPMTLITEDMIKLSGAKNINELLIMFVPGMSRTSSCSDNVSLRGITGLITQENMLVMLDGHSINNAVLNSALLDFSQNLEKIKQIEVLRGPSATSNSNSALTAVINIITRTGMDIDKAEIDLKIGKGNTYGGTVLCGDGNLTGDILAWASSYSTAGEPVNVKGKTHYIEGFSSLPSTDIGAKVRWGDIKFECSVSSSTTIPYQNMIRFSNSYSYDKYPKINGIKPGLCSYSLMLFTDYSHTSGNTNYSINAAYKQNQIQLYNVLCDSLSEESVKSFQVWAETDFVIPYGMWQFFSISSEEITASAMLTHNYKMANGMEGSLQVGINGGFYNTTDKTLMYGSNFNSQAYYTTSNMLYSDEPEYNFSTYVVMKHYFSKRLILNGGICYDHRYCIKDTDYGNISPRLSLIWMPSANFNLRGSFNRSVVIAPFMYRNAILYNEIPCPDLKPTSIESFQLTANIKNKNGLSFEANMFFNDVNRRIRFYSSSDKLFWANGRSYTNSGHIKIGGIENSLEYHSNRTFVNANLTYQYQFAFEHFDQEQNNNLEAYFNIDENVHDMENVPNFLFNTTIGQYIFKDSKAGSLRVSANMHVQSSYFYSKLIFDGQTFGNNSHEEIRQPAVALFSAGAEWNTRFGLNLSVNAYNLFNTKYIIGSQFSDGVPNRGFHIICNVGYDFGRKKKNY